MSAVNPSSGGDRRPGVPSLRGLNAGAIRPAEGRGGPIHICPECWSELVQPVEWAPIDTRHWRVELRCPDCSWTDVGLFQQHVVDRYDEILDRGTAELHEDLLCLERDNMEEEIESFVSALQGDLILPEDF